MKVLRFTEFEKHELLQNQLLDIIEMISNPILNEKLLDKKLIKSILSKLSNDLKFNLGLVGTFGTGITLMVPIVQRLIENSKLSVEMTEENLVLLCITVISITYLEESQNKTGEDENPDGEESKVKRKDAQTMLAELKMRGIGNGIVKKLVKVFKSIGEFFKIILKGTPYVIYGLIDMFSYAGIMIPCMNAISSYVGKYEMNMDTIIGNLLSLGVSGGALITKQGINWLMNKLKKSLKIKDINIPEIDDKVISPYDMIDIESETPKDSKLIKEHD